MSVLLVEDNIELANFAADGLTELGYSITLVDNATDALAELVVDADRFDVVFSDVVMPGMTGLDLAQAIRDRGIGVPVVLTTGYSEALSQDGAADFELVQKPYSIEELSRVLHRAAHGSAGSATAPPNEADTGTIGNRLISLALSGHAKAGQQSAKQGRKPPIVEIKGENGEEVAPPPPEVVEPDPELSPEEAEQARKDYLLTRFWISARGFWGRNGDRLAWLYSIGLGVLIVLTVGFQYGINVWNRAIFDAIEKREASTVFHLTAVFFPLAIGSIVLGVAQVFARMGIQRRWRAWLTASVLTRWLGNGRYYQLNLVGGDHKNPEYRIAEDLRVATDSPVDFLAGVTSALLSAATFIVVLWTIGGALTVTLCGSTITIPGFLVIAAMLYAAIASGSILVIGRQFVQVSEDKNQAEADFRYTLTRVRENGESIALLGGEEEERGGIDRNFTNVLRQWARLGGPAHAHHAGVAGLEPRCARSCRCCSARQNSSTAA